MRVLSVNQEYFPDEPNLFCEKIVNNRSDLILVLASLYLKLLLMFILL